VTDDLEQLYQTTYTAVVRFLYRKVWDAERAEDLAQEVFVRALAHRPEKPRAWIFAVAANLARDEARAAVRWPSRPSSPPPTPWSSMMNELPRSRRR
jgi:DNA-directed RNA polymerase specialized sigma24 family protein